METNSKPGVTNYFKQVTDFGKNVFTAELKNTGATYTIFDFVFNNILVLILLVIIIGLIVYGVTYIKNQNKIVENKTIEDSFSHAQLDNREKYELKCNDVDIPKELSKYTYAFNLIINDYYCNKGTWKCIMLKGVDITKYEPQQCSKFGDNNESLKINKNIDPEDCLKYVCSKEYRDFKLEGHEPNDLAVKIKPDDDDLNKRVDLICRAQKKGDVGKDLLACGMSKCNLLGQDMLLGHANAFIDAHTDYCTKVYTDKIKVNEKTKKRYADEIDNICSNKILIEKYPHLVPRDLTGFLNSKKLDRSNIDKFDDISVLSKEDLPVERTIETCWDDVITKLPIQAPGVWLHPFINNMRIVLTTYTSRPFDPNDFLFSHSHDSTSFTDRKYDIKKINKNATGTKHPNVVKYEETNCGKVSNVSDKAVLQSEYVYREFFDIENIPIKEIFHFALVINGYNAEVYINGKLVKTQILFGEPRYNKGDLYLNYGGNLNGSLMDFKYISHALNQNNVINLLRRKPMIQDGAALGIKIDKEHRHNLDFNHVHKYDHTLEEDHQHTLEDKNVPKDYYTED